MCPLGLGETVLLDLLSLRTPTLSTEVLFQLGRQGVALLRALWQSRVQGADTGTKNHTAEEKHI